MTTIIENFRWSTTYSVYVGRGWVTGAGSPSISSGITPVGQSLLIGSSVLVYRAIAATAAHTVGARLQMAGLPTTSATPIYLADGATTQVEARIYADGSVGITRNGTVLGQSAPAIVQAGVPFHIELTTQIAAATSQASTLAINGAVVVTVAAGANTRNTANSSASRFYLGNGSGNSFYFTDVHWRDSAVRLGDCVVDVAFPSGAGTYSAFTGSTAGALYTLVDESDANTTDYVESQVVGDKVTFTYTLPDRGTETVYAVQPLAYAAKSDAGARVGGYMVRSGGTDFDGAQIVSGTSFSATEQTTFETNPVGGAAWTRTSVQASEFGFKVVS